MFLPSDAFWMIQLTFLYVHEKTLLKDNNLFSVCHRFPKFFHLSSEKEDPNWAHRQWQICDDPADEGYTSQIAKQTKKATSGYLAKQHWTADPAKVATLFVDRKSRLLKECHDWSQRRKLIHHNSFNTFSFQRKTKQNKKTELIWSSFKERI